MEGLDFKSTNDRPIIGVLKALGFIDESGVPKQPYFDYMDDERHKAVLADALRKAYADLFKLNNKANEKDAAWVRNKLKMLTQGVKSDVVLARMAATFVALCKEGDFSTTATTPKDTKLEAPTSETIAPAPALGLREESPSYGKHQRFALAYNIHIELPAVRDQAVYPTQSLNLSGRILL